jgi:hypothetical protein
MTNTVPIHEATMPPKNSANITMVSIWGEVWCSIKKPDEDSGSGAGDYKTGEQDQGLHGQSALLRMIGQMVMAMLWRIPNNRRSTMRFMLIGWYENGVGVMVRATTGMGARGNGKRHTDAQHPKR